MMRNPSNDLPTASAPILEPPVQTWIAPIKLFRNSVVLGQLAFALGLPIVLLVGFLIILEWPPDAATFRSAFQVAGMLMGIFLVLLLIALGVIYRGRYTYRYQISARGIRATTHGRTARTNGLVNWLLLLMGHPAAASAGVLAAARQSEFVAWRDVTAVQGNPASHTITLLRGKRPLMIIACDTEQYASLLAYLRQATGVAG